MDRSDVENGIFRSWDFAEGLGLAETFSSGASLPVVEEWRNIAIREDRPYSEVYSAGLRLSHYNFSLNDYSFFQFSWESKNEVRYAFYPNPYIGSSVGAAQFRRYQDLLRNEFITIEEYFSILLDQPPEGRVPLIRYENSPQQRKELVHPSSHLHIGYHADNRWALKRILTPLAFTMLILKQYYGEHWTVHGADDTCCGGNRFEEALIRERANCFSLPADLFSAEEERSFHFG